MSDTPMGGPPDGGRNATQFNAVGSIQGSLNIKLPEVDSAARSVGLLVFHLQGLKSTLSNFSSTTGQSLNQMLIQIRNNATQAAMALGSLSGGGGPTPMGAGPTGGGPTAWAAQATSQASASVSSRMPGGIAAASQYLKGTESLGGGIVMGGLRFLRDRIATSRDLTLQSSGQLGMVARQQFGANQGGIEQIMKMMSQFPGNIQGTPQDLLDLFTNAPQYGASVPFRGGVSGNAMTGGFGQGQGPRAAGMLGGIREAQMLSPGQSVGEIMGNIGGFAANTGAQQQSAFLTGGAYSMIAAGGRQKTLSEWAESITKWLTGLRGSPNKDKPFTYGELMAQYFPGSNIDAWFQVNGVPAGMRTYWWTYALEKAQKGGTGAMKITPDETNLAWQRLQSTSEMTRTEFNLGAQMTGAYVNKEQANKWFNQLFGQMQTNLIPAFANSIGKFVEYLPDTLEDLLMSGIEGIAAGDVSGDTAWSGPGDIGDDNRGMYGSMGGTGLAGLSPNMRSKLGPMMRANPRLRINSGLRDNAMQKRLKDQGHSRVSGKPSAHTRGDAADLGPASQYGWIMKNASKFGLKSGKSQGEPWHVGVGDDSSDAWDMFSKFGTMLEGGASGVVDVVKWLFSRMFGMIPGINAAQPDTTDPSKKTGADFYSNLVEASKGLTIGGPLTGLPSSPNESGQGGGGGTLPTPNTDFPFENPGVPGGAVPGGDYAGRFGNSRSPAPNLERGKATANIASKYWSGETLVKMTGIALRESSWMPWAHRSDQPKSKLLGDRGLFQINNSNDASLMQKGIYSDKSQLFDPEINARAAYELYKGAGNTLFPWNMTSHGWDAKGDPMYGVNLVEARKAVQAAYLGDVVPTQQSMPAPYEGMAYQTSMPSPSGQGKTPVVFYNTFNIGNTGTGGGSGIDVRRTVTRVADLLEDEMGKRMARTN